MLYLAVARGMAPMVMWEPVPVPIPLFLPVACLRNFDCSLLLFGYTFCSAIRLFPVPETDFLPTTDFGEAAAELFCVFDTSDLFILLMGLLSAKIWLTSLFIVTVLLRSGLSIGVLAERVS